MDKCAACGILEQCQDNHGLLLFREQRICGRCRTAWLRLERIAGREVTWREFGDPKSPMYYYTSKVLANIKEGDNARRSETPSTSKEY